MARTTHGEFHGAQYVHRDPQTNAAERLDDVPAEEAASCRPCRAEIAAKWSQPSPLLRTERRCPVYYKLPRSRRAAGKPSLGTPGSGPPRSDLARDRQGSGVARLHGK